MRGLRITLIALAVVLLCEASRVWAAQLADSVIIEEPASLTADPSNGTADGVSVREPILRWCSTFSGLPTTTKSSMGWGSGNEMEVDAQEVHVSGDLPLAGRAARRPRGHGAQADCAADLP
jgi:hypothetical protein